MSIICEREFEEVFAQRMAEHYTDLPYHNFNGHVLSAIGYFESIADDLDAKKVPIDRHLGRLSILAHDAGYHKDHKVLGYDTKEAYSADIARVELSDMQLENPKIAIVSSAIEATHLNAEPGTNLEKAVRLADIGNVSANEIEFLRNMGLLIQEASVMKVPLKETFAEHCQATQNFLKAYIEPAPTFTSIDGTEVQLDRHMAFINNIARLGSLSLIKLTEASRRNLTIPRNWR